MAESQVQFPTPADVKLIITDVDGTLLTEDHMLHPTTLNAILGVRQLNPDLPIVIASGKQYNSCLAIRNALNLPPHFPAVHSHGSLLYGGYEGALLNVVPLDRDVIMLIVEHTIGRGVFLFTDAEVILINAQTNKDWCSIARNYDANVRDASDPMQRTHLLNEIKNGVIKIVKVTVCVNEPDIFVVMNGIEELQREAAATTSVQEFPPFVITRAIPFIIELVPPRVSKAAALRTICKNLNILPENVLAFGDGENDAEMLRMSRYAVSMGNAMPAARGAAKFQTGTNQEGGVGQFISKIYGFA